MGAKMLPQDAVGSRWGGGGGEGIRVDGKDVKALSGSLVQTVGRALSARQNVLAMIPLPDSGSLGPQSGDRKLAVQDRGGNGWEQAVIIKYCHRVIKCYC